MKKYKLEVNEEQLREISTACELMMRFRIGQLNKMDTIFYDKDFDIPSLDYCMRQAKVVLFNDLQSNESYGIYSNRTPKDAKTLFDIYKSINYELNTLTDWNVNSEPHTMLAGNYSVELEEVN